MAEKTLDDLWQDFVCLAVSTKPKRHTTHHSDCGCFTDAADALIVELTVGVCANCETCSPAGICTNEYALLSVTKGHPVQSDFRCRYHTRRRKESNA